MEIDTLQKLPIGIFDSGVGGLSAVKALAKKAPKESIVYLGDTARVPYGTRDDETIIQYAEQDMQFVLNQKVKAVLIACGTVSSLARNRLRSMTNIPVLGIIDSAAISAVKNTKNRKIAVLGTQATIQSKSYERAIHSIDASIKTIGVACPLFVPLVENGYIDEDNQVSSLVAYEYLKNVIDFGADTVILGCTHFPLLKAIIGKIVPEVKLIDASKESVIRLLSTLEEQNLRNQGNETGNYCFYSTGSSEKFRAVGEKFIGDEVFYNVKKITL